MRILVTGGTGYIGSHICVELLNSGYEVIIIDNLLNSNSIVINRIECITNKKVKFYKFDLKDKHKLNEIFKCEKIDIVIHCSDLKLVEDSIKNPLVYYNNNLSSLLNLCSVMQNNNVNKLIFSSSATIYGDCSEMPIKESSSGGIITNPYGNSKIMVEQILSDLYKSDNKWTIIVFRYFNPVGAHKSGLIGEDSKGNSNSLMSFISRVAIGKLDVLNIYGDDYSTRDGTCIRDFVHVVDLAKAYIMVIKSNIQPGYNVYNIGTGKGCSVLELLHTFEDICGKKIQYRIMQRRNGDVPVSYCDTSKIYKELGWKASMDIRDMCKDYWNWQKNNPNGYEN